MKITTSAPGKIMLFGEHAVVYGRPCLVTAIDTRVTVSAEDAEAMSVDLSGADPRFVNAAVSNFRDTYGLPKGIALKTSGFSSQMGFGSSSAVVAGVLQALSELTGKKLDNKKLFDLAYKTVLDVQGKGSGFDVAAAIYGGTLYFMTGGKIIEPLAVKDMPLVIGYTGVKADTVTLMAQVAEKMKAQPERVGRIYDAIAKLTEDAKVKIKEGDWERVGRLMDFNQEYLRDLGVSLEKLESLILAAKSNGAYGAKLSGAGGGDCMIALVSDKNRSAVETAITAIGGQVIHIKNNAAGVRVEL